MTAFVEAPDGAELPFRLAELELTAIERSARAGSYDLRVTRPVGGGIGRLRQGLIRPVDLLLVTPTVAAAVFAGRRGHVWIQVGVATAVGASLRRQTMQDSALLWISMLLFTFAVTALVVRRLLDLAVDSVRAARTGEITDPLTGLINRRGIERLGLPAWQDRARRRLPVGVLIVDVDHFKRVNDTLGHTAGDELLGEVADRLRACVRDDDLVIRLGGEEFAVLAEVPPGEAAALGERIRVRIERELDPVTVSVGVVETQPDPGDDLATIWQAVDAADHALYEAKRTGRNRVVSTPGPDGPWRIQPNPVVPGAGSVAS